MASADEIIKNEIELRRKSKEENPTTCAPSASAEKPAEDLPVQTIAKIAKDTITEQVRSGNKDMRDAAVDMVKAAATTKAAADNAEEYAEIAGEALTNEIKADTVQARSKVRKAGNEDNEAFYERYRPILEFDFGHITGNPKKKAEDAETRSYSKFFMVTTIAVAALPWLLIALVLYVLKGINAVVNLVSQFTRMSQIFIWTGVGLIAAYIILKIIAYYIEFYIGIDILPFGK